MASGLHPGNPALENLTFRFPRKGLIFLCVLSVEFFQLQNPGSTKFTMQKIRYIHNNPVEAGLVMRPQDYPYSSARDYCGDPGPVKLMLLDLITLTEV